jgi:GNAT superfamily N-acetyltransferase
VSSPTVRITTPADEVFAIDTVVLAFAADPVARWCWPDSHQYLTSMPSFTRAFAGGAFLHKGAHCTDDYAGAALWLPPNVQPQEEALGEVLERTVAASIRGDIFAVFEQMAKYHPDEPHWYLPMIGVDPAQQGKGYGSALISAPRLRSSRHNPGRRVATARADAPTTALSTQIGSERRPHVVLDHCGGVCRTVRWGGGLHQRG